MDEEVAATSVKMLTAPDAEKVRARERERERERDTDGDGVCCSLPVKDVTSSN